MLFVVLCPGTPEGSTGSVSGFKASQKTGHRLKVSSDSPILGVNTEERKTKPGPLVYKTKAYPLHHGGFDAPIMDTKYT